MTENVGTGWDGTVDKILNITKEESNFGFRNWLKNVPDKREFFSAEFYLRLYYVWLSINQKDKDHFLVIVGNEGSGKSTLARLIGATISPNFCQSQICFEPKEFYEAINRSQRGDVILADEGVLFTFSRESFSSGNRLFIRIATLMRQKNLLVILCIPDFLLLDKYLRNHRVRTLIRLFDDKHIGKFQCYNSFGVRYISQFLGRFQGRYAALKPPQGSWFYGFYRKGFPSINDLSEEKYLKKKKSNLGEVLSIAIKESEKVERRH